MALVLFRFRLRMSVRQKRNVEKTLFSRVQKNRYRYSLVDSTRSLTIQSNDSNRQRDRGPVRRPPGVTKRKSCLFLKNLILGANGADSKSWGQISFTLATREAEIWLDKNTRVQYTQLASAREREKSWEREQTTLCVKNYNVCWQIKYKSFSDKFQGLTW